MTRSHLLTVSQCYKHIAFEENYLLLTYVGLEGKLIPLLFSDQLCQMWVCIFNEKPYTEMKNYKDCISKRVL